MAGLTICKKMQINLNDLKLVYEEEIKKNVKNKRKIFLVERNKLEYLSDMKKTLEEGKYDGGKYNIFIIFKPKIRVVMSQSIYDKVINHYVTRFILMPKLEKYLSNRNCATRKGMGTSYAIKILLNDLEKFKKKYQNFYYMKIDTKKYFYTINHKILLKELAKDLNEEELKSYFK